MSDETPAPPPQASARTVLQVQAARGAIATLLVEMGVPVEIGTSALASDTTRKS